MELMNDAPISRLMARAVISVSAAAICATLLLSGCANVSTARMYQGFSEKPKAICVIRNRKTIVGQVVTGLEKAFDKRGIKHTFADSVEGCSGWKYTLTYSARRSWDFTTFLGRLDLKLYRSRKLVSEATYKSGKFVLTKWGQTEDRVDRLVGKLLGEEQGEDY